MNTKEIVRTERVTFVTTEAMKAKLKKVAASKGRSMSNYIETLIENALKRDQ